MKRIPVGTTLVRKRIVRPDETASVYKSGHVEVYATPAMIAFMESTCLISAEPFLEDGETTVGFEVCVRHLRAANVGDEVICESKVTHADDRKILFNVTVTCNNLIIGKGTHTRYTVLLAEFTGKGN